MRILFDQNLSPKLVEKLADIYPDSEHVQDIGFGDASDPVIWDYAKTNGYTIVTKDSDFHERRIISGTPPDVVWIRRGNCSTIEPKQEKTKTNILFHCPNSRVVSSQLFLYL